MKKNRGIIIFLAIMAFIIIGMKLILREGTGENSDVESSGGYKTIYDVEGIEFEIPSQMAVNATAISEVSSKIDILEDNYYVYKDGGNRYLLFCMDSIVIAVQKGTAFGEAESKDEIFNNASICNIWFENNGKETDIENTDGISFINDVSGGFVATDELYDDYVGKIAIISDGETEWSLFAGIRGVDKYRDLEDSQKKVIERISTSLNFTDYEYESEKTQTYEVTINNNENIEGGTEEIINTAEDKTGDEIISSNSEKMSDEKTAASSSEEVVNISETDGDGSAKEQSDNSVVNSEVNESNESLSQKKEDETSEEKRLDKVESLSIRRETNKLVDSKAYSSDIYSMLSEGSNGIINEVVPDTQNTSTVIINLQKIYAGDEAVNIIKNYCLRSGAYNYFEPEEGCNWQVAEYYLLYRGGEKPYINIKLKGIDGQKLKFRGISYSKKTYDILDQVKESTFSGPYYCYYSVPNGCSEYCLECGTGNIDVKTGSAAAYYLINQ